MWPEVETAKKEKRHELVLTGPNISERISKNGLDLSIFDLSTLNYLNISETCLEEIPEDISKLPNLQTLVLHSNKLKSVNPKIAQLEKLKILDLSRNQLTELPSEFQNTKNLVSLLLSGNKLESFPILTKNVKLSCLDLSNNMLTMFPEICHKDMSCLAELKLNGNSIETVPQSISLLTSLKFLDISSNKIKTLPGELVDCTKLKDINLKGNPIEDRRLLKLIDQCRTKQIMDYIKQHCPRTTEKNTTFEKNSNKKSKANHEEAPVHKEIEHRYTIKVYPSSDDFQVVVLDKVVSERGYFAGCIVDDISFNEETYKKFIQLQNKLHDSICHKRNNATIATHDYKKLPPGNLTYTTMPPKELKIKPLNSIKEMTGEELFSKLQTEANNLRKEKKRNTYSGIHKYLILVENKSEYPCVLNVNQEVISFPPITNSDISKIQLNTSKMFIEVTSSVGLQMCKSVMDTLLKEMVELFKKDLTIHQVKTVDKNGTLKVAYPSKTDLNLEEFGIKTDRLFKEDK